MRSACSRPAAGAPWGVGTSSTRSWAASGPVQDNARSIAKTGSLFFNPGTRWAHNSNVTGKVVNFRRSDAPAEDPVEGCRRGDPEALRAVFVAHSPYLERLLMRVMGPTADVEDVLQNTFVAAIRAFPSFRGEAAVRTWLSRIAIRTAQERLRRAEHRRRGNLPDLEAVADQTPVGRERGVDARRQLDAVYRHLEKIGPKKRVAFVLHVMEGHSMEEVAALTGATRAATKSRVFWARRELLKRATHDPVLKELLPEAEA